MQRPCKQSIKFSLLLPSLLVSGALFGDALFIRGDADGSGRRTITDAVSILSALFVGGKETELSCLDAADTDDNGQIEISDALQILQHLFVRRQRLPHPAIYCGHDPTPEGLDCDTYPACAGEVESIARDADAVVFVIDRSETMQDLGELEIAKRGVAAAVRELRDGGELGIVFFDRGVSSLPWTPPLLQSTRENRDAAASYVLAMGGGGGACVREGLLAALDLLQVSNAADKAIIYLGDGRGVCAGFEEAPYIQATLADVTERNTDGVKIHTIAVLGSGAEQRQWLRELAVMNGGTFHRVDK